MCISIILLNNNNDVRINQEINLIELHEKFGDAKVKFDELLEYVDIKRKVEILEEENQHFIEIVS